MFAVATAYDTLAPGLFVTKYADCAWESFFRAVSLRDKVSVVYHDPNTCRTIRAEYENEKFKFFPY